MLTQQRLFEVLQYSPETGLFTWNSKCGQGKSLVGATAGWIARKGYRRIEIDGVAYMAHRLAFLYMSGKWPENQVDHLDCNPDNNRWTNLADVDCATNMKRRKINARNTTGCPGVRYNARNDRWVVTIQCDGVRRFLGNFLNKTDAIARRIEAEQALGLIVIGREYAS
jgi:HNH endonuclease